MTLPFRQSTRGRLLLLVLLVAVPAFLVQLYGAWNDLQQDIAARKREAGLIVVRAQGNFATLLDTSRTVFSDLVRVNAMRTPDNCTQVFNDLHLAYERLAPDATNVGLSDAEGNIYCAINAVVGKRNIADEPHFRRAIQSLDMAIGDYAVNPSTGLPTLSVAYPVLSFDGKVETVIFISYELRWLEDWQKEVALPPGAALTLISVNGDILQRYLNGTTVPGGGNLTQTPWYRSLQNAQNGLEAPDIDGVTRLHTMAPLRLGSQTAAWLHLGYPVKEIYSQAQQALGWKLALLGVVFVMALGLAWWGSETLFLHPLNDLMRVVGKLQQGDLTARASSIPAVGELTGLAQAFDRMTESLQQRESARQEAQAEFQKADARFRVMFESAGIGIALVGMDRRPIEANSALIQMTGYTPEEFFQLSGVELSYSEDADIGIAELKEVLNGKLNSYQIEKRYVRKNGEIYWVRLTNSVVRAPDGKPQYFVSMVEDINQRKQAVEELYKSQARFQAIFDNVAVGVAVMGLDRKPIGFNAIAQRIIGYNADEMRYIDPRSLAVPEDRNMDNVWFSDLIQGKRNSYVMERRYQRKDGRIFWARINYSLVRDLEGQPDYLIGLIEDIDEQKRASERLAEQEADYLRTLQQRVQERTHKLEEANQLLQKEIEQRKKIEKELAEKAAEEAVTADRTRLARDLHDAVTQTLFSASLTAEVLPDLWEMDVEEAKRSTEELRQLTRGALAEMRTLLLELRPATLMQTHLSDLIKQLCEAFIGRSRLPITLTIEGDCQLPPEVQVAVYRIAQESLNNVFKYARATKVNVNLFILPSSVHFETCDNGLGFDMTTVKPTSLGMRIMRERAQAIGADLRISSMPGSGTCVELTWDANPNLKLRVL